MSQQPCNVLADLMTLAMEFAGRSVCPEDRVFADLDINGGDFIEFVEEVERRYSVDLSWLSPRDRQTVAQDTTLKALAVNVTEQMAEVR